MNQPFLSAYQNLTQLPTDTAVTGVWLLQGDEPLLAQWLLEKMQPTWRNHAVTVEHIDLTSGKSWHEVVGALGNLSLFGDNTAVIAQGNHKPDKDTLSQLQTALSENPQNTLVILSSKYDKKSQQTAFFQWCEKFGNVVDCQLYQENQRQQILAQRASEFGLQLTQESWQLLLAQTQNNLFTAYQSLWRLSYLYALPANAPVLIAPDQLKNALVSQSQFSTFDLADAMLAGQLETTLQILAHLKQADEPESLVLWVIAKEMRNLQSLQVGVTYQSLGIWQNKQALYQQALQRLTPASMQDWADRLYHCDQAIKGLIQQPAWELLYQLALAVAGYRLF